MGSLLIYFVTLMATVRTASIRSNNLNASSDGFVKSFIPKSIVISNDAITYWLKNILEPAPQSSIIRNNDRKSPPLIKIEGDYGAVDAARRNVAINEAEREITPNSDRTNNTSTNDAKQKAAPIFDQGIFTKKNNSDQTSRNALLQRVIDKQNANSKNPQLKNMKGNHLSKEDLMQSEELYQTFNAALVKTLKEIIFGSQ